ncbi:MepB family protein [Shinella zoogloeoides]|nr:MepB family protein [Shinella zoogloeoides]UEX83165.1 MepB family protein [Shinella zoogloeoides]
MELILVPKSSKKFHARLSSRLIEWAISIYEGPIHWQVWPRADASHRPHNPSKHMPDSTLDLLNDIIRNVYECAGMNLTHPAQREAESAEYGACRFGLDGHAVVFRIARTTPTKVGQFVTIWKRSTPQSEITPLDSADDVAFVVVSVSDAEHCGQFIFNRKVLLEKGVMSRGGKGGKRAIRVYPPWCKPTAKDAIRTQQWQVRCFLPLAADGTAESPEQVRMLFQA